MKYIDDLAKEYSDRRKNLSQEEAEEIIVSCIKYIKKKASSGDHYAIKLPKIGYLYKKFDNSKIVSAGLNTITTRDRAFVNSCYNTFHGTLLPFAKPKIETLYKGKSENYIIDFQNNND